MHIEALIISFSQEKDRHYPLAGVLPSTFTQAGPSKLQQLSGKFWYTDLMKGDQLAAAFMAQLSQFALPFTCRTKACASEWLQIRHQRLQVSDSAGRNNSDF